MAITPDAENSTATGGGATPKSILIVEDNEKNARMLVIMLGASGYDTHWAPDGSEGLRCACQLRPSLVITDLQMPGLDGLALTRALRRALTRPPSPSSL